MSQGHDLLIPVSETDHIRGKHGAPVTLVEYGDFECPYCGEAFPEVEAVLSGTDDIRFVFRHFPLTTAHPHAEGAAEAAEAAGAQGKFWQMYQTLYTNQDALDGRSLVTYAADLGLDQQQFITDLEQRRYRDRVKHDFMGGVRSGVPGTPCFFINGFRYRGGFDRDSLISAMRSVA